jgi:hypothetical protein
MSIKSKLGLFAAFGAMMGLSAIGGIQNTNNSGIKVSKAKENSNKDNSNNLQDLDNANRYINTNYDHLLSSGYIIDKHSCSPKEYGM